jgi:predicted dehydrogenase
MTPVRPLKVGIIGCGNISKAYFTNCKRFPDLEVVACADLDHQRAKDAAAEHGIARALPVDELFSDPEIELIINLTIPQAHSAVDVRALEAGKHVFSEKPFALSVEEGLRIREAARLADRRVGCAPDTVLGAAVQTARKLLDDGAIGTPVAFVATMLGGGPESWHPSPGFLYQKGAGPLFDMGPYYLHTLITLLGPVKRVTGHTRITYPERITKSGARIPVEVPTLSTAILEFASGVAGTLVMTFDVPGLVTNNQCIELYGTEGSLRVPDPNYTGGDVMLAAREEKEFRKMPHTHHYVEGSRGLGVADLAAALRLGRAHRANDEVALHTVEIMEAINVSSETGRHVELTTTCERPAAMRGELLEYVLD